MVAILENQLPGNNTQTYTFFAFLTEDSFTGNAFFWHLVFIGTVGHQCWQSDSPADISTKSCQNMLARPFGLHVSKTSAKMLLTFDDISAESFGQKETKLKFCRKLRSNTILCCEKVTKRVLHALIHDKYPFSLKNDHYLCQSNGTMSHQYGLGSMYW